ncbi:MAG: homoserine kinase [Caulobacterales bacterium]
MAVYTDLNDDDLQRVLEAYQLGQARALKGIAEGVSNTNFLLETERGRFILTIFEKRTDPADLPFFMDVMEHLAEHDFPAPLPLHTKDGSYFHDVNGKPLAVVSFLSGVSPHKPNVAQCRAIGATLAKLHLTLRDFTGKRANALGPSSWKAMITPRLALADYLRPGLADSVEKDLALIKDWRSGLPQGVIHADLFPDNALLVGDSVGGVIDFYFACTDALAYDLAVCLNAWCFETTKEYNITKGQALFAGYESVRKLQADEREAIPALARGAALRFFATRIADWADTPEGALVRPKNPLDYADRLDFHRKAKGAGDYGG